MSSGACALTLTTGERLATGERLEGRARALWRERCSVYARGGLTMDQPRPEQKGLLKYGIAWLLGVPVSVLAVIFLVSRGCG